MSDLKIDYAALHAAAQAAGTAKTTLDGAAKGFKGKSKLSSDAFTSKGEKAAKWYEEQLESMDKYLTNSLQSYEDIGKAFGQVAAVLQVLDDVLAKDGTITGGK